MIATFSGVDSVPRNLIRMAQSFNVPLWRIVWQVSVPGALSGMLAGFRISIAAALLVLVAAEMIGAQYGIGAFLILTGNMMQTDRLMAGVVVVSVLGLTMSVLDLGRRATAAALALSRAQRRFNADRPPARCSNT